MSHRSMFRLRRLRTSTNLRNNSQGEEERSPNWKPFSATFTGKQSSHRLLVGMAKARLCSPRTVNAGRFGAYAIGAGWSNATASYFPSSASFASLKNVNHILLKWYCPVFGLPARLYSHTGEHSLRISCPQAEISPFPFALQAIDVKITAQNQVRGSTYVAVSEPRDCEHVSALLGLQAKFRSRNC